MNDSSPQRPAPDFRWLLIPTLAVWLVTQCYSGLWHDSLLYSFQAQAHLHPDLLGNDLFLRYGSQDQYSLFSPIYAALIRLLGLENAAETLTLVMQAVLLYAIWQFASRQFTKTMAILALASVVAMPCGYGAGEVFHYIESFVSPRMAAEALALFSITAWFANRRLWSVLLWVGSCLLHPLMGLATAVMITWHALLKDYRKSAVALVLVAAVALALASRYSPWRMDDVWLATIHAGIRYLMLNDWNAISYNTALLPLVILACAALAFRGSPPGVTAAAALATGLSGLALSYVGGDLLHLTLVIQAQPWRWTWLSALIAAVVLPALAMRLWSANSMGRSAVLLMSAVFFLHSLRASLILSPLTIGAAWLATSEATLQKVPPNSLKLCERGAWAAAFIAVLWNVGNRLLVTRVVQVPGYVPTYYGKVYLLTSDGTLTVLLLLLAIASWYLARRMHGTDWWYACWSLVLLPAIVLAIPNYRQRIFTPPVSAVFARWKAIIPPRTEIFIPEDVLAGWTQLMRPSYYSLEQSASEVYSRPAAMELRERARAATSYVSRHGQQIWQDLVVKTDGEPDLWDLCISTKVRFIITHSDLHEPTLDVMPDSVGKPYAGLKLYACPPAQLIQQLR